MAKTLAIILAISMTISIFAVSFDVNAQEEIKEVGLYLYDSGDNARLSANFPQGNNTTEIETGRTGGGAGGLYFGGSNLGSWISAPISSPIKISGTLSVALWAKSDEGASGVMFTVDVSINDNYLGRINTESQDLSSNPTKCVGTRDFEDLDLKDGDKIEIEIIYWSESEIAYFGQGGSSTLLLGSEQFDSQLTLKPKSSPLSIGTISAKVNGEFVVISTSLNESFGADLTKLFYKLTVSGAVNGKTFSSVKTSGDRNNTTISFNWDYKNDSAVDGDYTILLGVSYDGKNFVQNSTKLPLKFPKQEGGGGGTIFEGNIGGIPILPLIIAVVAIGGIATAVGLMLKRRRGMVKFKKLSQEQPVSKTQSTQETTP